MSRRRNQGPYFRDRTWATRQKNKTTTLKATSRRTGLQHAFTNLEWWEGYAKQAAESGAARLESQILASMPFYAYCELAKINNKHLCVELDSPVYRFSNPKFGPLTIVGSISDGGRFNIGAAQMRPEFPSLQKAGCLYVSSSAECSVAEAALPHGLHKMYRLTPSRPLRLWDLHAVIDEMDYPNLLDAVINSGGERIWAYLKAPAISQILGHKVRALGGDGVRFESTRVNGHWNIGLFFETDSDALAMFKITEVPVPSIN